MPTPPVQGSTGRPQNVKGRTPPTPPPRMSSLKEQSPPEDTSVFYSHIEQPRRPLSAIPGSPSTWSPSFPDFRPSPSSSKISSGSCQRLPSRFSNVRTASRLTSFEQEAPTDAVYAQVLPKSERPHQLPNSRGKIPPTPPPRISSLKRRPSTTSDGYPTGTPPPLPPLMEKQDLPPGAPLRESRGRLLPTREAYKGMPVTPNDSQQDLTYSTILDLVRRDDNGGSSLGSGTNGAYDRISIQSESIQEITGSIHSPSIRTAPPSPPSFPAQRPLSELRIYASASEENVNPYAKPGPPDPYVGSSIVVGLTKGTFKKFIKDLDAAFVLFYDPCNKDGSWAKVNMREAALVTQRNKHVYAAVDCTKECKLCKSEGVKSMPTMKLYTRGKSLATYGDDTILSSRQMTSFVENTPVLSQSLCNKLNCFSR